MANDTSFLYRPDSADLALWAAWAHETLPGELRALQAREAAFATPAAFGSLAWKWPAFYRGGSPPTVLDMATAEAVASWCLAQGTPFAEVMGQLALHGLILLQGEFREADVPELLVDAALFFRDAEARIQGWANVSSFPDGDIWHTLRAEYVAVFRAKQKARAWTAMCL
jgi:hypothetical protein